MRKSILYRFIIIVLSATLSTICVLGIGETSKVGVPSSPQKISVKNLETHVVFDTSSFVAYSDYDSQVITDRYGIVVSITQATFALGVSKSSDYLLPEAYYEIDRGGPIATFYLYCNISCLKTEYEGYSWLVFRNEKGVYYVAPRMKEKREIRNGAMFGLMEGVLFGENGDMIYTYLDYHLQFASNGELDHHDWTMFGYVLHGQSVSKIRCLSNSDCGTNDWIGTPVCSNNDVNNDVYQNWIDFTCHNAGSQNAYCTNSTTLKLKTDCPKKCLNGVCVDCLSNADCAQGQNCVNNVCTSEPPPAGGCTFRTNVQAGDYYNSWDRGWIAYDFDRDGSLDGLGISGRGSWSSTRCNLPELLLTPTGDKLIDYGHSSRLLVCDLRNNKIVYFDVTDSSGTGAELSGNPTQPYTGNGQEVCTT